MRVKAAVLLFTLVFAAVVYAGSTGTAALHMPQSENASRPFGDFVSDADAGALHTFYRYFIEVTPGLSRLQVQIRDADVGIDTGGNESDLGRDRQRQGGWDSLATYRLFNPAGVQRTTVFTTGDDATPVGADNAWLDLYDSTGETFLDNFGAAAYTNNNGTVNWGGNWIETNDDANAGAGLILITGGELRIQDNGTGGVSTIERQADLSNVTAATLSFDFRTTGVEAGDQMRVEISNNGGGSWTTLETFTGAYAAQSRSYNITTSIAANTRVRFIQVTGYTTAAPADSFFVDNLQIEEDTIRPGHWELQVDMTQGTQDDEINAIGIRADDGDSSSGGREINVYADSMVSLGVNPAAGDTANTQTYLLYPWVTSGCQLSQNDFDLDTNIASSDPTATYTSRTGQFTQTFDDSDMSANNVWAHTLGNRFTDDNNADDYGIWTLTDFIDTYNDGGINGNYETKYVGNYLASLVTDPTTNPILGAGNAPATFRLYLGTDAGAAPVKPYLEQFITQIGGPHSPNLPVSTPTDFTITVRLVNPTPFPITFSATNLVTVRVPGTVGNPAGTTAVYVGPGTSEVTHGSIISEPGIGGTGDITWNPNTGGGNFPAGTTAILHYNVRITATAGSRVIATGTPAAGTGTRAQFVDETGNTTQTRATYLVGGICEVGVTQGAVTAALLSKFNVDVRAGATTVQWTTASEAGTLGFNLYRADGAKLNGSLIMAGNAPRGGKYEFVDRTNFDPTAGYILEEVTSSGVNRRHGPINHFEGVDREQLRGERRTQLRSSNRFAPATDALALVPSQKNNVAAMAGVRTTGIVRITSAELATALGRNVADVRKLISSKAGLSVTSKGAQVAWTSIDGDSILFFGEKSDSIYSNDRVYRIAPTLGGVKMAAVPVNGAVATPLSSFAAAREIETDAFAATALPVDPESDYWFWQAFFSGDPDFGPRTFTVNVPSVASASGASLVVRLQGASTDPAHQARVTLNNVPLGTVTWSSFAAKTATLTVPAALLRDGANDIIVEGVPDGGPDDIFYLDGFTMKYSRYASPEGGQIEVNRAAGGPLSAGPFTSAPLILDLNNRLNPSLLQGASFSGGNASLTTSAKKLFFAETFVTPSFLRGIEEAKFTNKLRADWVVVVPRAMRAPAESLALLRQAEGLVTYVADVEQIYDEFAGGNVTPYAIKDFFASWSKPPKYYVLAGTGSFDYRGIKQAPGPIPPLMTSTADGLFASDSLFVDKNGDRLPDAAIGRIPVSTAAELAAYVAKLDANADADPSTSKIIFSADTVDGGANFRSQSIIAEQPLSARPSTHIYLDDIGGSAARSAMLNAWGLGSSLVSWVGHGGFDQLSSEGVLTSFDAPALTSSGRLPTLVAMTCIINRFEVGYDDPDWGFVDPMGAVLTREPGAGAVAVWSASGLSVHSQAADIQRTFMLLASNTPSARIGDLIVKSLSAYSNDTSSIYLLLGDPAIRLDLPAPPPKGGPSSVGE